jgi:hypothetical protein
MPKAKKTTKPKSKIKRIINAIKKWKTRKTVLYTAIVMCVLYTACNCLFGIVNAQYGTVFSFDSTLTTEWFSFWKWVVISGGSITVAKVMKGNTNSDRDENAVVEQSNNDEEAQG